MLVARDSKFVKRVVGCWWLGVVKDLVLVVVESHPSKRSSDGAPGKDLVWTVVADPHLPKEGRYGTPGRRCVRRRWGKESCAVIGLCEKMHVIPISGQSDGTQ